MLTATVVLLNVASFFVLRINASESDTVNIVVLLVFFLVTMVTLVSAHLTSITDCEDTLINVQL